MMAAVAALWRHPIKSHGRESLESVTLAAGQTMPWDRHWAVLHDSARFDAATPAWVPCTSFMTGTRTPALAALWSTLDEAAQEVTLTHPDLGTLRFAPDDPEEAAHFLEWIAPLCPEDRARPAGIARVAGRGMTDTYYPSISLMSVASHKAVAARLSPDLAPERWRGNIWIDGTPEWSEFDWIGRTLQVGAAVLEVREPIQRCLHTAANPRTGDRDADTLGALEAGWGHRDFGVYAEVIEGGRVALGDSVVLQ